MYKYSFIVPVYNSSKYLRDCLESLINQTYKNFEIIIVDNESTDNSIDIIKEYIKKYSYIKLYKSKSSRVGGVRNLGIKYATGDYFITVDSDDYVSLDMLEVLNNNISSNYDLVRFNANVIGNDSCISMFKTEMFGEYSGIDGINGFIDEFLSFNKIFGPSWLFAIKTEFFKKNNFKFVNKLQEDFGLIPKVVISSSKILVIKDNLYNYVFHNESITNSSNNTWQKAIDVLYHYDSHISFINNKFSKEVIEKYKYYLLVTLIRKYIKLDSKDQDKYRLELLKRGIDVYEYINNNTNI